MNKILNLNGFLSVLDSVKNKSLPLFFDIGENIAPTGFASWRGSYNLLCIVPGGDRGESSEFYDTRELAEKYDGGFDSAFEKNSVQNVLDMGKKIVGKYMVGWKGGEYQVDEKDRFYVASIGSSSGILCGQSEDAYYQQIIGVEEKEDRVIIKTVYHNFF